VLGLVPFTFQAFSTVADHYLYPSMIGVALLAAAALLRARYAAWFAIAELVIAVLSIRSFDATRHWRDSNALFAHTLDVNPRSAMAHTNWAVALTHQHEDAAAIDHLQQPEAEEEDRVGVLRLRLGVLAHHRSDARGRAELHHRC
jgi:hypothetical protein